MKKGDIVPGKAPYNSPTTAYCDKSPQNSLEHKDGALPGRKAPSSNTSDSGDRKKLNRASFVELTHEIHSDGCL